MTDADVIKTLILQLTAYGKEQLKKFDNYEQRAEKLVEFLETMALKR